MLPTAGAAAFKLKSQDAPEMTPSEPMLDCCPNVTPFGKAMDGCVMANCATKCFNCSARAFQQMTQSGPCSETALDVELLFVRLIRLFTGR
jgi:hypothetical protein